MNKKKKSESALSYKSFRVGSAWLLLIVGIIMYIVGYWVFKSDEIWSEICIKVADVFVIGSVVGYLTNAALFLGVFKKELSDVIYGKDFVKKRNDLPEVWENLTKEMFKEKFPAISKDLLSVIKNNYLPVDVVNYYQDYDISIDFEWVDDDKKFVISKESINFDIVADNCNPFELSLGSWLDIEGLNEDQYYSKVPEFKVNGVDAEIIKDINIKECNKHHHQFVVKLNGSTKYDVSHKREKKYLFDRDYDISFRAKYIINKMKITFNYPEDLEVNLISRGTVLDFCNINEKKGQLQASYRGLILPKQGYVIVLNRKQNENEIV